MEKDVRLHNRLENLTRALAGLREALRGIEKEPSNYLYKVALIASFQLTYKLCWKTMRDYLVYEGTEVSLPRDVLKEAFRYGVVQDGQVWIDMLEEGNMLACAYEEQVAVEAGKNIRERYAPAIEKIYEDLLRRHPS